MCVTGHKKVNVCAHEWMLQKSNWFGSQNHQMEQQRTGGEEREGREDALLQLINQRLLAWK